MTEQHPITPPPELVEQLRSEAPHGIRDAGVTRELHLIAAAYRAGADQELKACCEWMVNHFHGMKDWAALLRAARRPKLPSLKEQALSELDSLENMGACNADTIRRALEQLDD